MMLGSMKVTYTRPVIWIHIRCNCLFQRKWVVLFELVLVLLVFHLYCGGIWAFCYPNEMDAMMLVSNDFFVRSFREIPSFHSDSKRFVNNMLIQTRNYVVILILSFQIRWWFSHNIDWLVWKIHSGVLSSRSNA